MRNKRFLSLLVAAVLVCGLVGCQADVDTGQGDTEQTVQEIQQSTTTTKKEQTQQTTQQTFEDEDIEKSETETSSESLGNTAETIIIAG